jgi:hypothetical protein
MMKSVPAYELSRCKVGRARRASCFQAAARYSVGHLSSRGVTVARDINAGWTRATTHRATSDRGVQCGERPEQHGEPGRTLARFQKRHNLDITAR